MNVDEVKRLVAAEFARPFNFTNLHGITPGNAASLCVIPFETDVDPDDGSNRMCRMWVVLKEPRVDGYAVAYDAQAEQWAVLEPAQHGGFLCVVVANSLSEALDGM
jgi:hypothetical protein